MNRFNWKRLRFEALERRDLLAVVRLAAWNTLNGPNDAADDANFSTVLAEIGSETVAGNTKRIDILAVQETDPSGSGGGSIGRIENILDALYTSTDYASVVSIVDGGGDSTGFIYDTSTLTLLESVDVLPGSLTHSILRAEFRPDGTLGESDLYVYSVHLKSGSAGSDKTIRSSEAALLRSDADSLGEGAAVLFVGDFNMQDSFEAAFSNFSASGAGQVQDVADALGDWSDNIAFKSLHTQNPRDNMNDRFDLQLASGEFFDGVGLEYVDNSFHAFGNDGSHTLNSAITTGTGASPSVLAALVSASDHLPTVADYEIIPSVPLLRIRETGGSTQTIEGGVYDTYNVVLDTIPTANVTVIVSPDAQIDLGFTTQLTFTPSNALTPQTIVVNALDDLVGEGNHGGLITHSVVSADADYDGLSVASVIVDIVDDDAPTIVINELDSNTPGVDNLEFIELYDGGVGSSSLDGITLVLFNGSTDTAYASIDLTGQATDADGFFVLGNASISGVDVTFANGLLQNGADAAALYSGLFAVGAGVTTTNLLDAVVYGTNDADDIGLLALLEPGQPQVDEDQNGNDNLESSSRIPDGGPPRETETFLAQLPTPGQLNAPPLPGVLLLQSGTRVDVEEAGATDSYQLALDTIPASPVMITIDPDDQTNLGAGAGVAIVLTFTPANALIPQTISVTAVDDAELEGDHRSIITNFVTSTDVNYDGLLLGDIVASITDNEVPSIPSVVISEIMYNPDSDESEPGIAEWIEIVNIGSTALDIGGWRFEDEDASAWGTFPSGTTLEPSQAAVFFDEEFTTTSVFRSEWSVPTSALVIGIPWGSLSNSPSSTDEILELLDNGNTQQDLVNFDDANLWPSDSPDGTSIALTNLLANNNVGSNWMKATVGVQDASSPSGPTFSVEDIGSPGFIPDSADFDGDGGIDGQDFLLWQRGFGLLSAAKGDGDADNNVTVNELDLAIWESQYGYAPVPAADFDLDTDVDGADFLAWQRGLGTIYSQGDLANWEVEFGQGGSSIASLQASESANASDLVDAALAFEWLNHNKEKEQVSIIPPQAFVEVSGDVFMALATAKVESHPQQTDVAKAQAGKAEQVSLEWLSSELLEKVFG